MGRLKIICENLGVFLIYIALLCFCSGNVSTPFLLTLSGVTISLFIVGFVANTIERIQRETKFRNALCPHNIKGGKSLKVCYLCLREQEDAERKFLIEQENIEYKIIIRKEADALRRSEQLRIKNILLQNEENLLLLSPKEFEDEVAELFRKLNYSVKQTSYSNDGGKDAIATKDGKKFVIECKRYDKDKKIGRPALQKFFAAMHEEKALKGFFVSSCSYAHTAVKYAKENNIELIDLKGLASLMNKAYGNSSETSCFQAMCLECGNILVFSLPDNETEKLCVCGSLVQKEIVIPINKKQSRPARYYRR